MRVASSSKSRLAPRALGGLVVLALVAVILVLSLNNSNRTKEQKGTSNSGPDVGRNAVQVHRPTPVSTNQSGEIRDGFRGDVHPLLHGPMKLDVVAAWTGLRKSQLKLEAPDPVLSWFSELRPVQLHRTYTERDFAVFLPESVTEVGELWSLDSDKIKQFLKQFHPSPSLHLVATGRRAGPDGAFAILRAVSPTHLDIAFRVHAEFFITPQVGNAMQAVYAWFTPAYFAGRVLVNKQTGMVEHFQLALPTEKSLNVFLTANPSLLGIPKLGHDIVRVERMELSAGDEKAADKITWTKALPLEDAKHRLAKVFYKFEEINWVPFEEVVTRAKSADRPVFAIVSWGSTDDQSC